MENLNSSLSKKGSNSTNAWDLIENFTMFTTGSVSTEVDKKLHFHEGEIKQVSRLPSCVGRVKDRRAATQKF